MRARGVWIAAAAGLLLVGLLMPSPAQAERAAAAEMDQVCENFLTYMVALQGAWAGDASPRIQDVQEVVIDGEVLARNYSIHPAGHVVVPALKDLPPVKAYSEECDIDVDAAGGFAALLREVLADRARRFVEAYGSLDAVQPATGFVLLGREHRERWEIFSADAPQFAGALGGSYMMQREEVGPLLTTRWHQSAPYNNFCPMGDGGRCVVGCVATATTQVMRYWAWPPVGVGQYCYMWNGDQSCGGDYGGGELCAYVSDPYDWENMPDHCGGGCSPEQEDALAELNYEVGVTENMDYGRCGSGTLTNAAIIALRNFFRYDPGLDQENRSEYNAATWFALIQEEINAGRPMIYRITGHAIVCDGWRDTGEQNEYHMNYGWGGSYNNWYVIDNLHMSDDPMNEYLIREIMPDPNAVFVVAPDGSGDLPTIQSAIDAVRDGNVIELTEGTFTGDGNRDLDLRTKAVTLRAAAGARGNCIIDCQGSEADPHRGFHFQGGETNATIIDGVTITGGHTGPSDPDGGAILCTNGSSPTIRNCTFVGNAGVPRGGAVYCGDTSEPLLLNCIFDANEATDGGGLCCYGPMPVIENCTFVSNTAAQGGHIAAINGSALEIDNCILAFSPQGEPAYCIAGGSVTLNCCDVYGNAAGDWVGCLAGQEGVSGNISADPIFCDMPSGDFTINSESPCVPFTDPNPECDLIGALGVGCGAIVVYEDGSGPFPTIQAAINAAIAGGTVELADGVFTGEGNRDLVFNGKAVTVRSQNGSPELCVIDCEGSAQDPHRGFYVNSGEGPGTVVTGLTVRNGFYDIAAGMYIDDASPTVRNVIFADNYADFGGAIRCRGVSTSLLEQVVFVGNEARIGGGIFTLGSACIPTLRNCTFYANAAQNYGAGMRCYDFSDPIVENAIIAFSTEGEAISAASGGEPVLSCTDIYGNAGGDWVGGIADQFGQDGNFSEDPLFCDAPNRDLTIDATSPCAAQNSPGDCGLVGARDIGCGDTSSGPGDDALAAGGRLQLRLPVPYSPGAGHQIRYSVPRADAHVELDVYDLSGRLIRRLVDGPQAAGSHAIVWDGRAANHSRVASGVYFCRLGCAGEELLRTLVVLR